VYRIRYHGRGGQGIKTASRILGTALFLEGFEVQDAPRYGAERRGAPIFAYVRASRQQINERGIIRRPDLVVVADDTLVSIPAAGVLSGLTNRSVLLISSNETPDVWKDRLNFSGQIVRVVTSEEVEDPLQLRFVGSACTGAAARLLGVLSGDSLEQAVREELSHLGEPVMEKNLDTALKTYHLMGDYRGVVREGGEISPGDYDKPEWVEFPFEEARISAPAIHGAATSVEVETGLWRTMRPIIDYSQCNRCWWVCSTFCPDSAIRVDTDGFPQIDYEHCKGCMICVTQCPSHAIQAVPEHEPELVGDRA
jgi:pyruvate ferredoxin oxidoreductase gamma subunit